VYVPPAQEIEDFLSGGIPEHRRLRIGTLRGNSRVGAFVDGHMIVSRHLAVLASTGAGKTVATRKILEELMGLGYPILIFDPHGDYEGLHIAQRTQVVTYLPQIRLQDETPDQVLSYLRGLSGELLSAPQEQFATGVLAALQDEKSRRELDAALEESGYAPLTKSLDQDHFFALAELADRIAELKAVDDRRPLPGRILKISQSLNCQSSTANAVARQCRRAGKQYWNMLRTNKAYSGDARELPSTQQLHELIAYKRVSIVSLEGYSDELRQSIVANLMQQLMHDRIGGKIPRFLSVIEEAHNFIPGWTALGDSERVAPSLPVIKQIATEGRKYGMGLILISQRPSRIDATVLSQANSYLILRIVNPNDQRYIRDVVETLGEAEARALPNLSTGEALLSGSFVRIPMMVRVDKSISEGKHEEEDFLKDLPGPGSSA
jgi:DNA helicase HerA-like ATPase